VRIEAAACAEAPEAGISTQQREQVIDNRGDHIIAANTLIQ
jgi:hypothetical protein